MISQVGRREPLTVEYLQSSRLTDTRLLFLNPFEFNSCLIRNWSPERLGNLLKGSYIRSKQTSQNLNMEFVKCSVILK